MSCSNGPFLRDRLKWTKELHDLFEKAVHQIGGPDRATPKGIMKAMGIPGLTIFHVKSHLQKYRMSIFTREEDHIRGKSERSLSDMMPELGIMSAAQLSEALQIQIKAHRRLSDQMEIQRSLKMKIEAQTRFLDNFMAEYKNRTASYKPVKPRSPRLSLPSLIEGFESESEEACTSDLMTTEDEFRASKRFKLQDNNNNYGMFPVNVMNNNSNNNDLYEHQEINFSWNVDALELSLTRDTYNP